MPIYEYQCPKCGVFEETQRITDKPLKKCPTCKGKVERIISATSFVLKGSGWYATDYAKSDKSKTESSSDTSGSGAASSGSSDKADSSSKSESAKSDGSAKSDSSAKSGTSSGKSETSSKPAAEKPAA
jgi:putative FmdB family regulatory protein